MSVININELGVDEWQIEKDEASDADIFTGHHPLPTGFHIESMGSKVHADEEYEEFTSEVDIALGDIVAGRVDQPGLTSKDRRAAARSIQRRAASVLAERFSAEAEGLTLSEQAGLATEYRNRVKNAGHGALLEVSNLRNVLNAPMEAIAEDELLARLLPILRDHPVVKPKRRRGRRGGRNRNKAAKPAQSETKVEDKPKAKRNRRRGGKGRKPQANAEVTVTEAKPKARRTNRRRNTRTQPNAQRSEQVNQPEAKPKAHRTNRRRNTRTQPNAQRSEQVNQPEATADGKAKRVGRGRNQRRGNPKAGSTRRPSPQGPRS
jgi:hypothetical protein